MRMRNRAGTALLVVSMGLAGCGAFPEESAVEQGPALDDSPRQDVSVEVDPPQPDASAEEVVAGFLRAGLSNEGGYQVARKYLTGQAAAQWDPTDGVVVHAGGDGLGVVEVSGGSVRIDTQTLGRVDPSGRLDPARAEDNDSFTLEVERVDGQWRIARIPEGLGVVVSQADFQRLYRDVDVHWGTVGRRQLVPDKRWVRDGEGLASALARLQTAQVPEELDGVLQTGVHPSTWLETATVPVVDGVATVRLSRAMTEQDAARRDLAAAQFMATLRQAPGVDAVSLEADGRPLETSATGAEHVTSPRAVDYSLADAEVPHLLLHQRQSLVAVDPRSTELEEAPTSATSDLPPIPASWERLAASRSLDVVAGVDQRQLAIWNRGVITTRTLDGALATPSTDPFGFVWTVRAYQGGGEVLLLDTADPMAEPQVVEHDWDTAAEVAEVRLSPEGARALVVLREGDTERIALAGVERSADGTPRRLGSLRALLPDVQAVEDLAWADADSLVVLGAPRQDGTQQVWSTDIGGWPQDEGTVDHAAAIAAYPEERGDGILVRTRGGRVLSKAGASWFVANVASDVVVPGR
ncbi:Sporulation and spore germination [Kytococcus aerolatus]|uniref:Sporulation and spore germination n=1 Tax=Kytococcus aerolatus TaxID=592308 RepID=A0A212U002_9MICO|nr:LpqB family beta-propeller domain-containing protein [Kytococcus aerolatus]SNC71480.1 Sporulation and spore germination [Kytococcus aerolatus]